MSSTPHPTTPDSSPHPLQGRCTLCTQVILLPHLLLWGKWHQHYTEINEVSHMTTQSDEENSSLLPLYQLFSSLCYILLTHPVSHGWPALSIPQYAFIPPQSFDVTAHPAPSHCSLIGLLRFPDSQRQSHCFCMFLYPCFWYPSRRYWPCKMTQWCK